MPRLPLSALPLLLTLARPASAEPAPSSFWERVAHPRRQRVEALVQRAAGDLGERPTAASREGAARAELWLRQALALEPDSFLATLMMGEAQARQGRVGEAATAFARARALARGPGEESWCALRAAVESSRAGRYADALADYDQHLRLGEAQPTAYANSAEILMALGRLAEAEGRYREAIRLEGQGLPGREHEENLALAYYGLAVALDRDDKPAAAREAVARALEGDPKMALLESAREEDAGIFFVPPGDVHYYRGLALDVLGRPREASEAFRHFLEAPQAARWSRRAEEHVGGTGGLRPAFRLVAVGTSRADQSLPAPLVDATLRGRSGLFDPCLDEVPAAQRETVRLALAIEVDEAGRVRRARLEGNGRPEWAAFAACAERRLAAVRVPRAAGATSSHWATARLELVLAPQR